jgi:hypothetical protein
MFWRGVVGIYTERLKDITMAVHLLRQQGVNVSFPMQTASGEIIFAVGNDFILTAEQVLDLLDRGDLHTEGLIRLVGAQAVQHSQTGANILNATRRLSQHEARSRVKS